jgi:hypothetical protein
MSAPADTRDAVGWTVVRATARAAGDVLGERLASVYALGSLAHGGFSPAISDIDVAVLTAGEQPTHAAAEQIALQVKGLGIPLADRLSIFHSPWAWLSTPREGSRFPAIDRLDLLRHGVLVSGTDQREHHSQLPTAQEIRTEAITFFSARLDPAFLAGFDPAAGVRASTKAVLAPVRLWHATHAGTVTNNDGAVEHYLATPDVRNAPLVTAAAQWRRQEASLDLATAAALIERHLLDLHVEVLELIAQAPGLATGRARDAVQRSLGQLQSTSRAPRGRIERSL